MTVKSVDEIVNKLFIFGQLHFIASWPHLFSKANTGMATLTHF